MISKLRSALSARGTAVSAEARVKMATARPETGSISPRSVSTEVKNHRSRERPESVMYSSPTAIFNVSTARITRYPVMNLHRENSG